MDNMNTNARESRKKFLAPLVVLLLCVVSLTGAAYAYSSTVTITGNNVTAEEYVLEVYDNTTPTAELVSDPLTLKALELSHTTTIGANDSVLVVAEAISNYSYIGKLTLKDTTVTGTSGNPYVYATVTPVGEITVNGSSITVDAVTGSGSIGYTISINLFKDNGGQKGVAYTAGEAITFNNHVATLWYEVTVEASGAGITFANYTAQDDIDAVKAALAEKQYTLSFLSQPTALEP